MGHPPSMAPFLQELLLVGPVFLLWKIWLEHNWRIFCGEQRLVQQIWLMFLGMIQETIAAKCDVEFPLERNDVELVKRLGIFGPSMALARDKR